MSKYYHKKLICPVLLFSLFLFFAWANVSYATPAVSPAENASSEEVALSQEFPASEEIVPAPEETTEKLPDSDNADCNEALSPQNITPTSPSEIADSDSENVTSNPADSSEEAEATTEEPVIESSDNPDPETESSFPAVSTSEENPAEKALENTPSNVLQTAPQMKQGWVQEDGLWYYYKEDGSTFHNQVITFGPDVAYYIGASGARQTGVFADVDGQMRYADADGLLSLNAGWQEYNNNRYYSKGDFGKLFFNQFITFGSAVKNYMDPLAALTYGKFDVNGRYYFADSQTGNLIGNARWEDDTFVTEQGETYQNQFITFGPDVAYYMGADGARVKNAVVSHSGKLYLLNADGNLNKDNNWVELGGKRYFPNARGELYANQFITFGPTVKYFMGTDGAQTFGKLCCNGRYYFADSQTGNLIGNARWEGDTFVTEQGATYQNRFITFGPDVAYYMGADGTRVKSSVVSHGGKLYLLNADGNLNKDNNWVELGGKRYFPNARGELYANQFITFGPAVKYFMGTDGAQTFGKLCCNGRYYFADSQTGNLIGNARWEGDTYVTEQGATYQNQFINFGPDVAYYMGADGARVKSSVVSHNGKLYLLNADGNLNKDNNWVELGGKRYFPNARGELYVNRFITFGIECAYWMGADGAMHVGWLNNSGNSYYLTSDGSAARGWRTIDSKTYYFSPLYYNTYRGFQRTGDRYHYFNLTNGSLFVGSTRVEGAPASLLFESRAATTDELSNQYLLRCSFSDLQAQEKENADYRNIDLLWPTPSSRLITSYFGPRDPLFGRWMHYGLDIGAPYGSSVIAIKSGKVVYCGWNAGHGNFIKVAHPDGTHSSYSHLSAFRTSNGAEVRAGDVIGLIGSTGDSTGPHLHLQIYVQGKPVDPLPLLQAMEAKQNRLIAVLNSLK
uniref:peptidoglycan DD-metalloendopeptidase family protein n=1 Tax=Ndongobacter massiliensis TaxID=1871025 RepID=UPI000931CF38|nr:peptidoglycan DD-metalloendopeptidase family protein [Ndongobacter massiliensis]